MELGRDHEVKYAITVYVITELYCMFLRIYFFVKLIHLDDPREKER